MRWKVIVGLNQREPARNQPENSTVLFLSQNRIFILHNDCPEYIRTYTVFCKETQNIYLKALELSTMWKINLEWSAWIRKEPDTVPWVMPQPITCTFFIKQVKGQNQPPTPQKCQSSWCVQYRPLFFNRVAVFLYVFSAELALYELSFNRKVYGYNRLI